MVAVEKKAGVQQCDIKQGNFRQTKLHRECSRMVAEEKKAGVQQRDIGQGNVRQTRHLRRERQNTYKGTILVMHVLQETNG